MLGKRNPKSDLPPLKPDELRAGFKVATGETVSWQIPFVELARHPAFSRERLDTDFIFKSRTPVRVGFLTLPNFYCYDRSRDQEFSPPENWYFTFPSFEPAMSDDELARLIAPLGESESSWWRAKPFDALMFGSYLNLQLYRGDTEWRGHFELNFIAYAAIREQRDPRTRTTTITDERHFAVRTSTVRVGHFDLTNASRIKFFSTPKAISDYSMCFWRDDVTGMSGISMYHQCISFARDDLKSMSVSSARYPGDRGDDYDVFTLNVELSGHQLLKIEFDDLKDFNAEEITAWLKRPN